MGSASSISIGSGDTPVGDADAFVGDFGSGSEGRSAIFRGELIGMLAWETSGKLKKGGGDRLKTTPMHPH